MPTSLPVVVLDVVVMTTSHAISNDKIGIKKTFNFQWTGGYAMDDKNVNENIDWLW